MTLVEHIRERVARWVLGLGSIVMTVMIGGLAVAIGSIIAVPLDWGVAQVRPDLEGRIVLWVFAGVVLVAWPYFRGLMIAGEVGAKKVTR